ncbi:MAG: hypothetical protein ACKVP5_11570 [Aestuariivirga sp.]
MRLNSLAVALYMSANGVIMEPSVPPPEELVGKSIDCKLKPGWSYDEKRGAFVDPKGAIAPPDALPKGARIVYKVPSLAARPARSLSAAERDLARYLQVILPSAKGQDQLLSAMRSWPAIEGAHATPQMSLPKMD